MWKYVVAGGMYVATAVHESLALLHAWWTIECPQAMQATGKLENGECAKCREVVRADIPFVLTDVPVEWTQSLASWYE
jgi:hypothetical protein